MRNGSGGMRTANDAITVRSNAMCTAIHSMSVTRGVTFSGHDAMGVADATIRLLSVGMPVLDGAMETRCDAMSVLRDAITARCDELNTVCAWTLVRYDEMIALAANSIARDE